MRENQDYIEYLLQIYQYFDLDQNGCKLKVISFLVVREQSSYYIYYYTAPLKEEGMKLGQFLPYFLWKLLSIVFDSNSLCTSNSSVPGITVGKTKKNRHTSLIHDLTVLLNNVIID